jgi:hypothetical protein
LRRKTKERQKDKRKAEREKKGRKRKERQRYYLHFTQVYQLSDQVVELDQYRDLDMAITVGDKARSLQAELDEAEKLSSLYQQHEKLFDFPPSSTATTLPQLLKEFEPMHTLWTTASDWVSLFIFFYVIYVTRINCKCR